LSDLIAIRHGQLCMPPLFFSSQQLGDIIDYLCASWLIYALFWSYVHFLPCLFTYYLCCIYVLEYTNKYNNNNWPIIIIYITLNMTQSFCAPILFYGLDCVFMYKSLPGSLNFCWSRVMYKIIYIFESGCAETYFIWIIYSVISAWSLQASVLSLYVL